MFPNRTEKRIYIIERDNSRKKEGGITMYKKPMKWEDDSSVKTMAPLEAHICRQRHLPHADGLRSDRQERQELNRHDLQQLTEGAINTERQTISLRFIKEEIQ